MRMMSIASGSSGNCIYIGTEQTHILIDAGISRKRIADGLKSADLSLSDIDAVFITHEHSDHIKGLGVMSRKDEIPLYTSQGTMQGIKSVKTLGDISDDLFHVIEPDGNVSIKDINVHSFSVSHDANQPMAFTVTSGEKKAAVITDLGCFDDYIVQNLLGTQSVLVEANHDVNLLQVGGYPYYLKQRILGDKGHLSNETSGRLINCLLHDNMKHILLGHLSKENNYDKLAYETVRLEIDMGDHKYKASDFDIQVAHRDMPTDMFTF